MSAPFRVRVGPDEATQDLWRLAENDDTLQLEQILARGADINATNEDGVTALMRAASNGRVRIVRALIDHGADLNATRSDGFTPLLLAAFFGHLEVVRTLVESGAELGQVTRFGTSAEMWARSRSFPAIAHYLEQARRKPVTVEPALEWTAPELSPKSGACAESELRMERPASPVLDESFSARRNKTEDRQASNSHLVVRTLKDPPEIWELVHAVPVEFKPGLALGTRLMSSKRNIVLLIVAVAFIAGVCVYAGIALRGKQMHPGAAAQISEDHKANQIPSASAAPAGAALRSDVVTTPSTSTGVQAGDPAVRNQQPGDPGNTLTETTPFPGANVGLSTRKLSSQSRRNKAQIKSPGDTRETAAAGASFPPAQITGPKSETKEKSESASATKKSSPAIMNSQLIAPHPSNAPPKAKVIQWP